MPQKHLLENLLQQGKFAVLYLMLSLVSVGCCANYDLKRTDKFASLDSLMRMEIGDSLSNIIIKSQRIEIERINSFPDSMKVISSKRLSSEEKGVIKFLLVTNKWQAMETPAFGKFTPNVLFTFTYKKSKCFILIDFGLKQLSVRDEKMEEIKRVKVGNNHFLQVCNIIFPNDRFLMFLLNQ